MKQKYIYIIIIMMLVLTGCGTNKSSNLDTNNEGENVNGNQTIEKENMSNNDISKIPVGQITEEMVRNYPVASAKDFEYEIDGDGIKITEYIGNDKIVVIPEKIEGKNVVGLASLVFANDSTVRGVYIPTTIKKIDSLFTNSTTVEVIICEGVEELTNYAFGNCSSLHTVILGENLKSIGDYCFFSCPSLKTLFIPNSVIEIGKQSVRTVFYGSTNLTIIGNTGSTIEAYAKKYGIKFQAK